MFPGCLLWISHLWGLLCESIMPTTPNSQTPSTSAPNAMASTTDSQTLSTFVSTSTPTQYDVFLSFRGEDTRLTFTSHLYDKLHSNGISTFKDDPELRSGEVISDALIDAIRKSKAYIVVLSENYASSSWCLDELAEILNCHKTMQRCVIPVFFNIDPSVVRHQTGSFQKAFKKHQNRFRGETEKLKNWQLILKQVADFSGHHISKHRSEADVINEIVDELLLQINPKTLDVAKYPVGLDSRVEAITTLLSSDTKGVIKLGIYGMGGVGKTTLAKALFNQLLEGGSFTGSCFLANVREASSTFKGLESLQQQLINDVLRCTTKVEVHNVDQGIKLIEARICATKVVVVIDDLDNLNNFQSLVGPFASGSVVIITTRDEEILDITEVGTRYRYLVNTLDGADSLALFTQHAFGNAEPSDSLMKLSKDILRLAAGLPLALEIFGSHLFNKSEVGWKYYIKKLQQIPISNIQQRLEISLDALESEDPVLKKVFLDIACFFIRWEKKEVVPIMDSYYSYADHFIDTLRKRCLLTINYGRLGMHDLLQDVGKEIVRKSSPDEPEKRSRLWVSKDICDVLQNQNGTDAIECIICRFGECALDGVTLTADTFKRMRKLRFLKLENVNITGSLEQKFEDLRWLYWKRCPLECLPSEFYPQKLAILELTCSNITTMWELNMVPHVFEKLKTLNVSHSRDLVTTPDFMKLPSLETLNLKFCESLEEVHMSIGSLVRLDSLNLQGCKKLRNLPDTICNLRALKVLNISLCISLEALPLQLGNIESLTKLHADELSVSKLPGSTGHLTKLVELSLNNNKNLETLPDSICDLRSLEILNISDCSSLEALPMAIGNIESLKKIIMYGLNVSKLPDSIGSLTKLVELDLEDNEIETLPDTICNLRSLETVSINGCEKVKNLPNQLWKITGLRELNARLATGLRKLPDLEPSMIVLSLQKMDLFMSGITVLPSGFGQLSNLQSLDLSRCHDLLFIPKLPPNLKWITASDCTSMERLPDLSNLKQLEKLDLSRCSALKEISGLEELSALKLLGLKDCSGLKDIQGLEELASIRILRLRDLDSLLAFKLTKQLFQKYSGFGREISVYAAEFLDWHQWTDWIVESPYWTGQSSKSQSKTVYADLLPNKSHNFMGIILCFKRRPKDCSSMSFKYSVTNTTSGFIWNNSLDVPGKYESLMVMVPKSIFLITDDDHKIELIADEVKIVGIHLLYKTETTMIVDVVKKT